MASPSLFHLAPLSPEHFQCAEAKAAVLLHRIGESRLGIPSTGEIQVAALEITLASLLRIIAPPHRVEAVMQAIAANVVSRCQGVLTANPPVLATGNQEPSTAKPRS